MKLIVLITAGVFIFSQKAVALSWDELMNKPFDSIKTFFAAAVPVPAAAGAAERLTPQDLQPADAKTYLENEKPVLIDIRTTDEYAAGHLANSAQMDYYAPDFKDKLSKLDKSAKYLIYCRSGHRSGLALGIMKDLGFTDAHDIAGGINAWLAAGYPVVKA